MNKNPMQTDQESKKNDADSFEYFKIDTGIVRSFLTREIKKLSALYARHTNQGRTDRLLTQRTSIDDVCKFAAEQKELRGTVHNLINWYGILDSEYYNTASYSGALRALPQYIDLYKQQLKALDEHDAIEDLVVECAYSDYKERYHFAPAEEKKLWPRKPEELSLASIAVNNAPITVEIIKPKPIRPNSNLPDIKAPKSKNKMTQADAHSRLPSIPEANEEAEMPNSQTALFQYGPNVSSFFALNSKKQNELTPSYDFYNVPLQVIEADCSFISNKTKSRIA